MGKLPKKNRVRGTAATYRLRTRKKDVVDLDELASLYSNAGNIPVHLGWGKACEIAMLARYFVIYRKENRRLLKSSKAVHACEPKGETT